MRTRSISVCFALVLLGNITGDWARPQGGERKPIAFDLPAKQTWYILLEFPAKHKAQLSVTSEKDGDVDLFVIDPTGKTVASDVTVGKDAKVEFTTKETAQVLLVKVSNVAADKNRCALEHNGKTVAPPAPFELGIAPGAKHAIFLHSPKGNVITLESSAKGKLGLAIHDVEGVKIAADPKGFVTCWENKGARIVRVTVTNQGKDQLSTRLVPTSWNLKPTTLPPFELEQGAKKMFDVEFPAETLTAVWVKSDKDSDVDLIVLDKDGKEVISDITIGKDCFAGFMPKETGRYRIVVVNQGPGSNRCMLSHTGEAGKK